MKSLRDVVVLLSEAEREEIVALRKRCLMKAEGFEAEARVLEWSESDRTATHLGYYADGQLAAAIKLEILADAEAASRQLDFDGIGKEVTFPVGVLGKAVTLEAYRGNGLSTILREAAFRMVHEQGVRFVVGTVMPGAPQLRLKREPGSRFVENPDGWRRYGYDSHGMTWVVIIDLDARFERATRCREVVCESIAS